MRAMKMPMKYRVEYLFMSSSKRYSNASPSRPRKPNHCGMVKITVPRTPSAMVIPSTIDSFSRIKINAMMAAINGPVMKLIMLDRVSGIKATALNWHSLEAKFRAERSSKTR